MLPVVHALLLVDHYEFLASTKIAPLSGSTLITCFTERRLLRAIGAAAAIRHLSFGDVASGVASI